MFRCFNSKDILLKGVLFYGKSKWQRNDKRTVPQLYSRGNEEITGRKKGEEDMREVKKFISIDNKEFDNKKECIDYEQNILDYIRSKIMNVNCLECQLNSLCKYLDEINVYEGNLCSFIMDNIKKKFSK